MAKVKKKQKTQGAVGLYVAVGAGALLLVAVLLMALQGPGGSPGTTNTEALVGADGIPRASLEQAKQALDAGTAVFVDVRGDEVYAMEHVKGALSIPLGEVESRLGELDPAAWIIPYCT
jgi:hypothetical protein